MVPSIRMLVTVGSLAFLSACGGQHAAMSPSATPPPTSQMLVVGTLTGSPTALQMGGQALDVSAASVTVNGQPGSAADLQPGVILRGKGASTGSECRLTSADVRPDLCGPITAVDAAAGQMTVLAKVVRVDALTILVQEQPDHTYAAMSLADFKVGDGVRVFGATQTDGSFLATRIERRLPRIPNVMELRGVVSSLDATAMTFMLGPITVNYSLARVHGTLANGIQVETGGTLSGMTFAAARVEVEDDADDAGSSVEARGALSVLDTTAKTFTLLTFKVDYSAATVKGTLVDGAVVEVEGNLSTTVPNTLLATKVAVKFGHHGRGASDREIKGSLSAVNATDLTLTVGGTTYWTDGQTVFVKADAAIAFTDLKVGDMVEVRVLSTQTNTAGQPYAPRVEVEGMH